MTTYDDFVQQGGQIRIEEGENEVNSPMYRLDVSGSANASFLYENGIALRDTYLELSGGTITGELFIDGSHTELSSALLNLHKTHPSETSQVLINSQFDKNWGLALEQHHTANNDVNYEMKQTYHTLKSDVLAFKRGNVGIGTPEPSTKLNLHYTHKAIQVSSHHNHTVVLFNDGTVKTFGFNQYGELGTGTSNTTPNPIPTKVIGLDTEFVISVSAGVNHTALLLSNGTVKTFGSNRHGQLGTTTNINTTNANPTPVLVNGITNAVSVSCGNRHTAVVLSDGTVKTFGSNSLGQLGRTENSGEFVSDATPTLVSGITNAVSVFCGSNHTLVITEDGRVITFGSNRYGQLGRSTNSGTSTATPNPGYVSGINTAVQASCSNIHTAVLLADGTVKTFGMNKNGQLGRNANMNTSYPNPTPDFADGITNAVNVSCGGTHTVFVLSNGQVKTTGNPTDGQLGYTSIFNLVLPPTEIDEINTAVYSTAGIYHTAVLLEDGTINTFGRNTYGQLGNTINNNTNTANPERLEVEQLYDTFTLFKIDSYRSSFQFNTKSTNEYSSEFLLNDTGLIIGIDSSNRDIMFHTNTDTEHMRITSSGTVGIGTSTPVPSYKLDVSGSIHGTTVYENGSSLVSKYAPISHTHSISDINNLQTTLNAKLENNDVNTFARSGYSIQTSDLPSEILTESEGDTRYLQSVPAEYLTESEGNNTYARLSGNNIFTGTNNFDTNRNIDPFIISSESDADEVMKIGIDDANTHFHYTNDGSESSIRFTLENTDAKLGGVDASTRTPFTIKSDSVNGRVGINTTTPNNSYSLDVSGDIHFSGNLYQNGSLFTSGDGGGTSGSIDTSDFASLSSSNTFASNQIINGNVGIGTSTPSALLGIVKTHDSATTENIIETKFDDNWGLRLVQNYVGSGDIKYELKQTYNNTEYDVLSFRDGHVGIGTTTPDSILKIYNPESSTATTLPTLLIESESGAFIGRTGLNSNNGGAGSSNLILKCVKGEGRLDVSPELNGGSIAFEGWYHSLGFNQLFGAIRGRKRFNNDSTEGVLEFWAGTSNALGGYNVTNYVNDQPYSPGIVLVGVGSTQRIGIGTTEPERICHIKGDDDMLRMDGINNPYISFSYGSTRYWAVGPISSSNDHMYVGWRLGGSGNVVVGGNCPVGVGVLNPAERFEVFGNVRASGFVTSSDIRIKTNITDLEDNECLHLVRQLKPVKYEYIDKKHQGDSTVYGFIAQDIREVIPYASNVIKSFIPDYYKNVEIIQYDSSYIVFDISENYDISQNQQIKIDIDYVFDGSANTHETEIKISELSGNRITIENELERLVRGGLDIEDEPELDFSINSIFLYGKFVDDFHTIKKDAIWTICCSALQEIDKNQQQHQTDINTLQQEKNILQQQINEQNTIINNLIARVEALESSTI